MSKPPKLAQGDLTFGDNHKCEPSHGTMPHPSSGGVPIASEAGSNSNESVVSRPPKLAQGQPNFGGNHQCETSHGTMPHPSSGGVPIASEAGPNPSESGGSSPPKPAQGELTFGDNHQCTDKELYHQANMPHQSSGGVPSAFEAGLNTSKPESLSSVPIKELTPGQKSPVEEVRPAHLTRGEEPQSNESPHQINRPADSSASHSLSPEAFELAKGLPISDQGGIAAFATPGAEKPDHCRSHDHQEQFQVPCDREISTQAHQAECTEHPSKPAHEPTAMEEEDVSFTQEMVDKAKTWEDAHEPADMHNPTKSETHIIQIIRADHPIPQVIQVHKDATVGSITIAESSLHAMQQPIRVSTCVGTPIPLSATTTPLQQIFLTEMKDVVENILPEYLTSWQQAPRAHILLRQQAWVAEDEMEFYLQMITTADHANVGPILVLPNVVLDDELEDRLTGWFNKIAHQCSQAPKIISAMIIDNHWFPVCMTVQQQKLIIHTSPGGHAWLEIAARRSPLNFTIIPVTVPHLFPNDCGFQAVAWITAAVFEADFGEPLQRVAPLTVENAITWRSIFEHALRTRDTIQSVVPPASIAFGGVSHHELTEQLEALLHNRGVPTEEASARATAVLEKLGRQPIAKALRTTNPWKEIKQLANLATPKLQLVLPSEMQAAIQARAESGKFGDKKNKQKANKEPRRSVNISATDIAIPEGIFRDASSTQMKQIPLASIGPEARGLVVVQADQAVPYLRFSQPVSKHGLALIVVDYQSPLIHGSGEEIRFPARCEKTNEPILITARIIQIGAIEVCRLTPAQATVVDEVSTEVVRIVVYRDELTDMGWASFCSKPIKAIVDDMPALQKVQGNSPIIDIWDRQWLNDKLERMKPADANMFSACFRLEIADWYDLLQHHGTIAHYVEPRSYDGRSHHEEFRVIWINKQDRQAVLLASQSTAQWNVVVRSGNRFGLRVKASEAQAVHTQHKPSTPYLASSEILTFHAGPFPHGSNRAALLKLFATWGWQARPSQPRHRTPDGRGVVWEIQAASRPQYEVYQLSHADVLISEVPKKQKPTHIAHQVQGSIKTIAALSKPAVPNQEVDFLQDNDPWGNFQGTVSKPAQSNGIREEHLNVITARVAKKMRETNPILPGTSDNDVTMGDDRVTALEERVAKMETTIKDQHEQQAQITGQLASQITAVQTQVERQTNAIHSHIDSKMQEQLNHIERLFSKKSRTE